MTRNNHFKRNLILICAIIFTIIAIKNVLISKTFSNHAFTGKAIGTFYNIKISHTPLSSGETVAWKQELTELFKKISKTFSVFESNSELNYVNNTLLINTPAKISNDLYYVLSQSKKIYQKTDGYFDISISPLIEIWGFGKNNLKTIPSSEMIAQTLKKIGLDKITLLKNNFIIKTANIHLNLGAIAKGYAVDKVSSLLRKKGCEHFMVEVGGEVFALGLNSKYKGWTIGIQRPNSNLLPDHSIMDILELNNKAVATSGSYRNFFQEKNKTYSHLINPKTGYPANGQILSVSVIANTCLEADGYATALFLVGKDRGMEIIEKDPSLEVYFIIKNNEGKLSVVKSKGFDVNSL